MNMKAELQKKFNEEITFSKQYYKDKNLNQSFKHLERAHILGQRYFFNHLYVHWLMLKVGIKRQDVKEIIGQLIRIVAVFPGYLTGWVPKGNTGGANVSALKPMPISEEFLPLLFDYHVWKDVSWRIFFLFLFGLIFTLISIFALEVNRMSKSKQIAAEWDKREITYVKNFGSTKSLEIMPLVNWYASDSKFKTEAGVSYLIKTDKETILFDVGFNRNKLSPSPLEHNMSMLDIALRDIDSIFISHPHLDHVGGSHWENKNTISIGNEQKPYNGNIYTTKKIQYPGAKIKLIQEPTIIGKGIATTGPIARQLFIGRIDEQALIINLEGKGLVAIVGCGHQTMPKLIEAIEESFDIPLYGIVGDLHYPVPNGRIRVAGMDAQRRLASGSGPFKPISIDAVHNEMEMLRSKLQFIALGSHDTSDQVLSDFKKRFGNDYYHVLVGQNIIVK